MASQGLKVALVHDWLTNIAGGEKVLLALSEMFPQAPIYTSVYNKKLAGFKDKEVISSWLQRWPAAQKKHQMYPTLRELAFESFDFSDYDLVISDSSAEAKGIITPTETLHISYIHTPTRYYWSGYEDYVHDPGLGVMSTPARKMLPRMVEKRRKWDYAAAQRPDVLVANSQTVADRIKKYYNRSSIVVFPPVDTNRFRSTQKKKNYFICFGRLVPYKRVDLAIEACNKTGDELVIIGDGPIRKRLQKMAAKNVRFLGSTDDKTIEKYVEEAKAMLFCGEEDFGITCVEAMAAGTPVLAYKKGGAAESVEDGVSGLFFNEQSVEAVIDGIERIKTSSWNTEKVRARSLQFSQAAFMKNMTRVIDEALKKRA